MKKGNQRIDLEFEKPIVKFIEQYRMRVNGGSNKDVTDYKIEDKLQKKIKTNNDEDPVIVQNSDDDNDNIHDYENAQIVESNGNDGNLDFNFLKFKPEYVGTKKQKNEKEQQKTIHSIIDQQEKIENQSKKIEIKKQQTAQTKPQLPQKKSKIDELIKKSNKPTILSFEQDDY